MPAIRSTAEIAAKWATVTPGRAAFYKSGVTTPKKDWETETKAAEDAYELGVTNAIGRKAFGKGVDKAGTAKWKRKAVDVGAGRWGPGVRVAEADFRSGYDPYRAKILEITLDPRFPKGDPRNYDRVRNIGDALHALKIGA